jgi:hypothetical protein
MRARPSLIFSVVGLLACASHTRAQDPLDRMTNYQLQMRAESISLANHHDTTYVRRMRDLQRRARLVHTDSLARLYAAIPRTPDSLRSALRLEVGCEMSRLLAPAGAPAFLRAFDRMRDSLERLGIDAHHLGAELSAAPGPPLMLPSPQCGLPRPRKQLPDSLNFDPYPGYPWGDTSSRVPGTS